MEAVPKLPMISFQVKLSPDNAELNAKLKQLISERFGENPSAFTNEIKEFETLRANTCIRVAESIDGVAALKKYYCQVVFLKNRFKISNMMAFPFSWNELYNQSNFASTDVDYELASVLYNIGALHTRLGANECRDEADGMKMAVAHFQCAAWAFHSLPDLYNQDVESDLNGDLMGIISQISLAQAQECILEKSILDNRKPTIISKVGGQVVEYYKQAIKSIEHSNSKEHGDRIIDFIGNKQQNQWAALIKFKMKYYASLSLLHMGMLSEENQKMGERVSYYQASSDALTEASKLAKKLDSVHKTVAEPLMYAGDVINGKLDNAKKENEFIYHEKVADIDTLPEIKGASLVKGIPFDVSDPEVSGKDIFHRLVPLEAHEASSLYSEEQAKLLRTILSETESSNNELTVYMSALQLEDIPSEEEYANIPQQLIECAAGLSLRTTAVSQLQEGMASLAGVSADVEASLMEIQKLLTEEKEKEKQYQDIVGPRSSPIITELEKETQKYQEAHSMASESNLTLNKAMRLHVKNLQLLSKPLPELEAEIPQISSLDESVLHSLTSIKEIISKVEEMRGQRHQLMDNLREAIKNDDITNSLASKGNKDNQKVFEDELKKHQATVDYIRQNIRAQNNILAALTEKNAEYAIAREKVGAFVRDRNEMIGGLVSSFHVYEDLLDKTTKGLEFYAKLEQNVTKLSSRVEGVVKVQEEERDQLIASSSKKMAEAREKSFALINGSQTIPPQKPPTTLSISDYKSEFAPGAPPPDTPEHPLPGVTGNTKPPGNSRPKLKDYLMARKDGSKEDKDQLPGVRPPPVGSEAEPVNPAHMAVGTTRIPGNTGQYPGNYGQYMSNQGIPGQYTSNSGMTGHYPANAGQHTGYPGMMYPPGFYQNPQFAAMYAQSLSMVKGLQGGIPSTTSTSQPQSSSTTPQPQITQSPGQNIPQTTTPQNIPQTSAQSIQKPVAQTYQHPSTQSYLHTHMQNYQQHFTGIQHPSAHNFQQQQQQQVNQQPTAVSNQQPTVLSNQQPTIPSNQQPTIPNNQQPTVTSNQQPTVPSNQQPTVPSNQQPIVNSPQQPAVQGNQQPFVQNNHQTSIQTNQQHPTIQSNQQPPIQHNQQSNQQPPAQTNQQPTAQINQQSTVNSNQHFTPQSMTQFQNTGMQTPYSTYGSSGTAVPYSQHPNYAASPTRQQFQPGYTGNTTHASPQGVSVASNSNQMYYPTSSSQQVLGTQQQALPRPQLQQHQTQLHNQQQYYGNYQQNMSNNVSMQNYLNQQQRVAMSGLSTAAIPGISTATLSNASTASLSSVSTGKMNPVVPMPGSIQHQDGLNKQMSQTGYQNPGINQYSNSSVSSQITGTNQLQHNFPANQFPSGQVSTNNMRQMTPAPASYAVTSNYTGYNIGQGASSGQMTSTYVYGQPRLQTSQPAPNNQQIAGAVRPATNGQTGYQIPVHPGQQISGQFRQQTPVQVRPQVAGQQQQQIPGQVRPQFPVHSGQYMHGQVGHQMPQGQISTPGQTGQQVGQIRQQGPYISGQLNQQFVSQSQPTLSNQQNIPQVNQVQPVYPNQQGTFNTSQHTNTMQQGVHHPGGPQQQFQKPGSQQPGANQPGIQQPPINQPSVMQQNIHHHGAQQQAMKQPGVVQQNIQPPGVQPPGVYQPGVQQPNVQQPNVQQPNVQQPGVEQIVQQPGVQQPGVQQPAVQQPAVQQPTVQQPTVQQPTVQQSGIQLPLHGSQQQPANQQPNALQSGSGNQQLETSNLSNLDLLAGLTVDASKLSASAVTSIVSSGVSSVASMSLQSQMPSLMANSKSLTVSEVQSTVNKEALIHEKQRLDQLLDSLDVATIWKKIQETVEKDVAMKKLSISVARCYSTKNRSPDVLPFDQSRVALLNTKDDYINASSINGLAQGSPDFILTQLPFRGSLSDLMELVWQEGIETMVTLVPQVDMGDAAYLPVDKQSLAIESYTVTCQSLKETPSYRERVLNICNGVTRQTRAILHIEMTGWAGPDLPPIDKRQQFLLPGIDRILALRKLQRYPGKPVLVHCRDGGSKSGTLSLLLAAISQIQENSSMPDTVAIFSNLLQSRKGVISDKIYIRFYLEMLQAYLASELSSHQTGMLSCPINQQPPFQPPLEIIPQLHNPQLSQETTTTVDEQNIAVDFLEDDIIQVVKQDEDNIPVTLTEADDCVDNTGITSGIVINDEAIGTEANITETSISGEAHIAELTRFEGLTLNDSPSRRKISKEDFINPSNSLGSSSIDPSDPLSSLDPLWSLGKK